MNETPVIAVRDLTKTYAVGDIEVRALRGVSLEISSGEVVGLLGGDVSPDNARAAVARAARG